MNDKIFLLLTETDLSVHALIKMLININTLQNSSSPPHQVVFMLVLSSVYPLTALILMNLWTSRRNNLRPWMMGRGGRMMTKGLWQEWFFGGLCKTFFQFVQENITWISAQKYISLEPKNSQAFHNYICIHGHKTIVWTISCFEVYYVSRVIVNAEEILLN